MNAALKADFPFFTHHPDVVYLDSAATAQKLAVALDATTRAYIHHTAPIYRGLYQEAEQATLVYESVRRDIAQFLGCQAGEIAFCSSATDASNQCAASLIPALCTAGDAIVTTTAEHHATLLPWHVYARNHGVHVQVVAYRSSYDELTQAVIDACTDRTRMIVLSATSNVVGPYLDWHAIATYARARGIRVCIDASQAVAHEEYRLRDLPIDVLWYSSHKVYGPTGVGVLYIARDLHPMLQPARYGGGMVDEVSLDHPRWQPFPRLFEAGTPALAELCGHRAALEWLAKTRLRLPVHEHEHACTRRFIEGLRALDDTYLILGDIHHIMSAGHVVSFYHPRFHAHDLAWFLGQQRICVRSGHQCAQPLHQHLGCAASVRVSIGAYTTIQDIDTCLSALAEAHTVL